MFCSCSLTHSHPRLPPFFPIIGFVSLGNIMCMQCPWKSEGAPDPLELELQMFMRYHMGAGNL